MKASRLFDSRGHRRLCILFCVTFLCVFLLSSCIAFINEPLPDYLFYRKTPEECPMFPLPSSFQSESVTHNISFHGFFPHTKFLPCLFNSGTVILLMDKEDPNAFSTTLISLGWYLRWEGTSQIYICVKLAYCFSCPSLIASKPIGEY